MSNREGRRRATREAQHTSKRRKVQQWTRGEKRFFALCMAIPLCILLVQIASAVSLATTGRCLKCLVTGNRNCGFAHRATSTQRRKEAP